MQLSLFLLLTTTKNPEEDMENQCKKDSKSYRDEGRQAEDFETQGTSAVMSEKAS